jgi:hypothetical protein
MIGLLCSLECLSLPRYYQQNTEVLYLSHVVSGSCVPVDVLGLPYTHAVARYFPAATLLLSTQLIARKPSNSRYETCPPQYMNSILPNPQRKDQDPTPAPLPVPTPLQLSQPSHHPASSMSPTGFLVLTLAHGTAHVIATASAAAPRSALIAPTVAARLRRASLRRSTLIWRRAHASFVTAARRVHRAGSTRRSSGPATEIAVAAPVAGVSHRRSALARARSRAVAVVSAATAAAVASHWRRTPHVVHRRTASAKLCAHSARRVSQ